ncbi:MAG TPA: ABC transporter permease [Solirubrobacteraceae bacterium]|nr:ABC transporter permease [Solirubrobacteraceae bacterium]
MSIVDIPIEDAGALQAGRTEIRREVFRELLHSATFIVGAVILLFWIICAIFGPAIVPHDPYAQSLLGINKPPSSAHWFGTDQLGRDMFSRVIVGSRDVLIVAPLATLLGTVLGTILGLFMGYFRGLVDDVLGRFVEAILALPVVVTGVIVLATLGRSNLTLIIVIGLLFTPLIARTVRAAVLLERELDYVGAARLRGERAPYIMFVEILPNVFAPIMVEFTVRLAYAIFAVLTLTFLGLGIQPPSPDWALDISTNYGVVPAGYWWEVVFDAVAIATLVVSITLISDSVQGALEG